MTFNCEKILLSNLQERILPENFDVFILAASFESRCKQIAANFSHDNFAKIIICKNDPTYEETNMNFSHISDHFMSAAESLILSKESPISTVDAFLDAVEAHKLQDKNILIDITCFTHESLLILQKVVSHFGLSVSYIYSPADEYNPKTQNFDKKWLSLGTGDVRSILGYSGINDPLSADHLIVLVGFEFERAKKLISEYAPTRLSLGHTIDFVSGKALQRTQQRFNELRGIYPDADSFEFSTKDIGVTKNAIEKQIAKHENTNPIVAPMNTKISTLALALAAEDNESIQVCYASALSYNYKDYSSPSDHCYFFRLNSA